MGVFNIKCWVLVANLGNEDKRGSATHLSHKLCICDPSC